MKGNPHGPFPDPPYQPLVCICPGPCVIPGHWQEQHEDPGEGIREPVEPLSDETIRKLAEAGIVLSDWQPQIVSDDDATQILAFHKFLCSGEWVQTEEGEPLFQVDQNTFDYATGKMTAKEYLDAPES